MDSNKVRFRLTETMMEKILERCGLAPEDKGQYFIILCPACGKKEAYIYKDKEWIVCNRKNKCSFTTSIWNLSREIIYDKDVISSIAREFGNPDFKAIDMVDKSEGVEIPEGTKFFASVKDGIIRNKAYNYLKRRNITDKIINEFGYIYDPGSEFDETIFVPFYEDGRLVYFITRDFSERENALRYKYPHEVSSKEFIYNIDKIKEDGIVFIFEGIFDAISLSKQVGTAMLSADLGKTQAIKIMNRAPGKIVFVPDNDEAGRKSLEKNIKKVLLYKPPSINLKIYVYYIKEGKDFNEMRRNFINLDGCIEWTRNPLKKIRWQNKIII